MSQLAFEERFALLVDRQWLWKENRALARRLRSAHLKERGVLEDVDYHHPRKLDRKLMRTLAASEWVRQNQNLLLLGPTGIGKSWLACALAQKACRDGFSVLHKRAAELVRDLEVAHADGSIGRVLLKLSRIDVLVPEPVAVPIYGDMAKFLAIQPKESDCLFARGSRPVKNFRESWIQACQRAGVPNLLFHDLRRTAVRNLRRAGAAETVIMKITGHRTRSMFERYNITDQSDTQEAGRMAEEFLERQHQGLSQTLSHNTERPN